MSPLCALCVPSDVPFVCLERNRLCWRLSPEEWNGVGTPPISAAGSVLRLLSIRLLDPDKHVLLREVRAIMIQRGGVVPRQVVKARFDHRVLMRAHLPRDP